jgi:Zn-dependent protease with chaperone function
MMKFKEAIWKQHKIGQTWGRFALAGSQISIFISTYTMLMVTVNAYAPVSSWLVGIGIHLQFWQFLGVLLLPMIIAYVLAWKFLVQSYYRTSVEQFWQQGKEWTDKLDKIDELEKNQKIMLEMLEKLQK